MEKSKEINPRKLFSSDQITSIEQYIKGELQFMTSGIDGVVRSDDARAFAVKATLKPQKYQLPQDNSELIEEVSQLRSTYNGKGTQDLMAAVKRMHKIDAEEAVILDGIRRLIKGVLLSALNELKAPLTDGDSSSDLSCES